MKERVFDGIARFAFFTGEFTEAVADHVYPLLWKIRLNSMAFRGILLAATNDVATVSSSVTFISATR